MTAPDFDNLRTTLTRLGRKPPTKRWLSKWWKGLNLRGGKGTGKEGDRCSLQEVRALEGLDPSTDKVPDTDCPVCGRFLIRFQDGIKDQELRNRLCAPLLVKIVGSKSSKAVEKARAWLAVDWVLRECLPMWLDMNPELAEHAAALRALPEITDKKTAEAASQIRDRARSSAWQLRCTRLDELRKKSADAAAYAAYAAAAYAADAYAAAAAAAAADAAADPKRREKVLEEVRALLRATSIKSHESGARCLERMLGVEDGAR